MRFSEELKNVIHYGNSRIDRKFSTCGVHASWEKDSIDPSKVTCIHCVDILANPRFETRNTKIWKMRYEELKKNG